MSIGNANIHQVSEIPEITKLPNGRLRVVRRFNKFTREDVDNANYGSLMGDFGDLDTEGQQLVNQGYTDLQLISVEVDNRFNAVTNNSNAVLVKTYETLTSSFVQVTDEDQIEELENGIKRLTRVLRAQSGTTYSGNVGITTTTVNLLDYTLSKSDLKDSGAFAELTLTFLTTGITDVREDIVGSQKAIIITKVGSEPSTLEASSKSDITYDGSSDWSIARKDVSQEGGLKVYTYTFLLDNTILSQSQDKQGSLKTEVIEVFNPKVTIPGIKVEGGSNIAGDYFKNSTTIGGKNFYQQKTGSLYEKSISYNSSTSTWTFSVHSTIYSSSTDVNPDNSLDPPTTGWSGEEDSELFNMTFRDFDQTLPQSTNGLDTSHRYEKDGYSLINIQRSNLDGIPTMRYTFAKPSIISVTQDFVEDVNTIQVTAFDKTATEVKTDLDEVTTNHKLINQRENNHDGIATTTYTFEVNESDVIRYTSNNRLQVVRTTYESNSYDYNANYDVGSTNITFTDAGNTTLVLSELRVNKRGSTGTFVKLEAIFTEPGESSRSESTGPTGMPGTERVTITSSGSTPVTLTETDDIKLVTKQEQNNNGFSVFVRSYIKGTDATSTTNSYTEDRTYKINSNGDYSSVGGPSTGVIGDYFQATSDGELGSGVTAYLVGQIIGTKITYDDIIDVAVPGTVKCKTKDADTPQLTAFASETWTDAVTGSTAGLSDKKQSYLEVIPPSSKKIKATVTESILTSIPDITQLAYNLDDINCSVTKIKTNVNQQPGGIVKTSTNSIGAGFSRSIGFGTNNSYFPGCYLLDSNNTASSTIKEGNLYRIITYSNSGGTAFTSLGASDNNVGTTFVATSDGTADGTARWFGAEAFFAYVSSNMPYVHGTSNQSIGRRLGESDQKSELLPVGTTVQNDGSAPSSYITTGVIQQKARPVLTTIDGTTYYEVIKFSNS